jgi:predicted O-linked N-acetylglucosamine transferase (SPINDLY family)
MKKTGRKQKQKSTATRPRHTKHGNAPDLNRLLANAERNPGDAANLKELGGHWIRLQEWGKARAVLQQAMAAAPKDWEAPTLLAQVSLQEGNDTEAIELLSNAVQLNPDFAQAQHDLALVLYLRGKHDEALGYSEAALHLQPDNPAMLFMHASVVKALYRYDEALELFDELLKQAPDNFIYWMDAANIRRDLGLIEEAITYYEKAMSLSGSDAHSYSNWLTTLHYDPAQTPESLFEACRKWQELYAPQRIQSRPKPTDLRPDKKLRIGLISDGFRNHPVGTMITSALEQLDDAGFELFAYSSNNVVDELTVRLHTKCARWTSITRIMGEPLADLIREDEIDILIDLAGHNAGSRMPVMAMQPAPLLIKWVGGLINSTGLSAIDYLISDSIESPSDDDRYYTEKLIRMPDDYICYTPPNYLPDVGPLPAIQNGYVTLGCFNNPTKINKEVLREWAALMREIPNSRLLLKSFQYNSSDLRQRIKNTLNANGIDESRVQLEGPVGHGELLDAYNRVDIALDPWPYSGGLTTCEALIMGVPVVTLPGESFAGRHSATHLINAGLPELVVHNWDEYRARILSLVADVESLATIRANLRSTFLQSPVCNAKQFASHLGDALRAIWQRYLDGKNPVSLNFNHEGRPHFEGEPEAVSLMHPEPCLPEATEQFEWTLEGRVIAIDHGGSLLKAPPVKRMLELSSLELIVFDPANTHVKNTIQNRRQVHYYPNMLLGNGNPATLYACQAPERTGTLPPLTSSSHPRDVAQGLTLLATLPIKSLALDQVSELPSIDWLVLDDLHDCNQILENGRRSLVDTLLVHAKVAFQPTHEGQPAFRDVIAWAEIHGFRFYNFHDLVLRGHLPDRADIVNRQNTELVAANAIFIPQKERLERLERRQRVKLAFILSNYYGIKDMAYEILAMDDKDYALKYLISENIAPRRKGPEDTADDHPKSARLLFFPDYSHANPYQKLLYSIFPKDIRITTGVPWSLENNHATGSDIFHLHWEDVIYRHASNEVEAFRFVDGFLKQLEGSKSSGWKLIWTIHNEAPHENQFPKVDQYFRAKLSNLVDIILVHSEAAYVLQSKAFPAHAEKLRILPTGSYEGFYPNTISTADARNEIGIPQDRRVFLFFGNIRPYKGLDDLLKAFSSPEIQRTNALLLIVGTGPAHQYAKEFYSGKPDNIKIVNRAIADEEIQTYFAASDFCVFTFKKILTSGSVMLSYTFKTPIIIPDFDSLSEFSGEGKGSITYRNNSMNTLKKALVKCCELSDIEYSHICHETENVLMKYRWSNFSHIAHQLTYGLLSSADFSNNADPAPTTKTRSIDTNDVQHLTILVFGRQASDIETWIKNHRNINLSAYNIVFAFSENDVRTATVPLNNVRISKHQDENATLRVTKTLEEIETSYVILCASDDVITRIPSNSEIAENFTDRTVAGLTGTVTFRHNNGSLTLAKSNELDLSMLQTPARLSTYWTPPFPSDNSIMYSIFRTADLTSAFRSISHEPFEASDWVLVTALLKKGRFIKSILSTLREKTPSENYVVSFLSRSRGKKPENILHQASEKLKTILDEDEYTRVHPGLDQWKKIKDDEVKIIEDTLNE